MKKIYNNILELREDIFHVSKENPKIAILGAIFSGFDGVSRVIEQQSKDLSMESNVSIITLEGNMDAPENVELIVLGSPQILWLNRIYRLFWPLNIISIIKCLNKLKNHDLVIAHQYPLTFLAYLLKKIYNVKYIYWYHTIPPGYSKIHEKLYIKLIEYLDEKSFIIRKADYICSVSEFSKKILYGKSRMDSIVVYNTINKHFIKKEMNNKKIRKLLSLGEKPVILFVGRIHPNKNIQTLIKVFELVKEQIPNAILLIVGEIIFKSYYNDIKEYADDSVIFVGYVPDRKSVV